MYAATGKAVHHRIRKRDLRPPPTPPGDCLAIYFYDEAANSPPFFLAGPTDGQVVRIPVPTAMLPTKVITMTTGCERGCEILFYAFGKASTST